MLLEQNMFGLTSISGPSSGAGGLNNNNPCRQKKGRRSRPKVKTGCLSCKQRRIKCGEERPACTQCVRSKKVCRGYPAPPRSKNYKEMPIAPKPSQNSLILATTPPNNSRQGFSFSVFPPSLLARPSQSVRAFTPPETPRYYSLTIHRPSSIPFTPHEGQYFQLFKDYTASELSGFFDSSFWTKRVLQECHSEESIRHAVVALGALYKTLEKITESPPSSPSGSDYSDNASQHWYVALEHYSMAIKAAVGSETQDMAKTQTSLMASVLLVCFDSFIGHHQQTIVHIQKGLSLLEGIRNEHRQDGQAPRQDPVEQDLVQMFTRLAIQAKSYDLAFHFPQPYVIRLTPSSGTSSPSSGDGGSPVSLSLSPIPDVFASLHDARLAWDMICENTMKFTEQMLACVKMMKMPMNILPQEFRQFGKECEEKMDAWVKAFDPILASRMSPAKTTQEKTATAVLKMNQIMGRILFNMTFSASESEFDNFLPGFRDIVDLAVEVIGDEEQRAANRRCPNPGLCRHQSVHPDIFGGDYTARHIKPSFSADLGIIPPLFVVATKCRHYLTRHQAIQLLRTSSRREGMWDSEMCAQIGLWIANIEEEDSMPDSARPASRSTEASEWSTSSPGTMSADSPVLGDDLPLGPGGNARWEGRRESVPFSPYARYEAISIPESKRIMVRAVEFDLRERVANIECGHRRLLPGTSDSQTRKTTLRW